MQHIADQDIYHQDLKRERHEHTPLELGPLCFFMYEIMPSIGVIKKIHKQCTTAIQFCRLKHQATPTSVSRASVVTAEFSISEDLEGWVAADSVATTDGLVRWAVYLRQRDGRVFLGEGLGRLLVLWSQSLAVATPEKTRVNYQYHSGQETDTAIMKLIIVLSD